MKSIQLLFAVTLFNCSTLVVLAQPTTGITQSSVGVRSGVNFSKIVTYSPIPGLGVKTGAYFSFYYNYVWKRTLSFQPELSYSRRGYKGTFEKLKSAYIEVPVLMKLSLPLKKEAEKPPLLFLNIGPYIGFMVSNNYKNTQFKEEITRFPSSRVLEGGFIYGIGIYYPLSKEKGNGGITADIRHTVGLTNINDEYGHNRNRVISICVGYQILISDLKTMLGKSGKNMPLMKMEEGAE